MKKLTKALSLVTLCAVMIIMSVVPAFAVTASGIENHNIIDCPNRYIDSSGKYNFYIKIPKGCSLNDVEVLVAFNRENPKWYSLSTQGMGITYEYSDNDSDYYELVLESYSDAVGIKLFCNVNGICYMATDIANGNTLPGLGYWLIK